jgi:hypothetical protein
MGKLKKKIDWGEAIVPGLGLAFGLAYFLQTFDGPGVALYWPISIAVVVGMLGVGVVVQFIFVKKDEQDGQRLDFSRIWSESRPPRLILLGSVGYLLAVPWLGFSLSNLCFMTVIVRGLGSRKWILNVVVALGIAIFLHIVLIFFMKLSLPRLSLGPVTI